MRLEDLFVETLERDGVTARLFVGTAGETPPVELLRDATLKSGGEVVASSKNGEVIVFFPTGHPWVDAKTDARESALRIASGLSSSTDLCVSRVEVVTE